MASSATSPPVVLPQGKSPPPPETRGLSEVRAPRRGHYFRVAVGNVILRFLLFACALVAVSVMGTSDETQLINLPFPPFQAPLTLHFTDSPAYVYFIAALSVAGLYSFITTILSFFALFSPRLSRRMFHHFILFDVLLLLAVSAATGAAATLAYTSMHGDSNVGWIKVCNTYGSFCRYIAAAVIISFVGSLVLALLVLHSLRSSSISTTRD